VSVTTRTADELEIRNLVARLTWEADNADIDDLDAYVGCFTEDATWEREGDVRRGRDELRQGAEERRRSGTMGPGTTVFHSLSCTEVTFEDEDRAKARSYFHVYRDGPDDPVIFLRGKYYDVFSRTSAGWKLAERKLVL
jgi:3-phenylpropionate/cinnamic acid dioxygenase small subunit